MNRNRTYRLLSFYIPLAVTFVILSALILAVQSIKPQVKATIKLQDITRDEYYGLLNFSDYDIEHIKKLYVQVDITSPSNCKKRDIYIPDLMAIDRYDRIRSFEMSFSELNNLDQDHAQSVRCLIFDTTGLSLEDLRKIYADQLITVNIETQVGNTFTYTYPISDFISDTHTD